ncbi:undecaprenyl-phosphate galactosephosphotransferase [Microcystis aeruginosa NIES-44]|nr:undecaprenyl-phosphate galactosephosphotransferase [Microcystis aeruginosa NIES-44]
MEYPVLRMPDRLTVLEAVQFKDLFHHLIAQTPTPEKVILDLNATQFMDSSGVGALVHNLKAARAENIELVLANVHPPVMGVLSITGLDQLFTFQTPPLAPQENGFTATENDLPETHPSIRSWLKRCLDIVGGIVGLLITGFIFVPIAIAIKLDSPGPIFFSQTRCGWLGKQFKILKFRSMCVDAEALKDKIPNQAQGAFFKNKNDPRITRVGKFLRRTSLDELPQFWNVITGEMSLVGTRPPTPDEVERYDVPQWQRLDVKPGMTGEWQVNGRSRVRNFEEVIQLDLRYQENWSLGYDLQLIFKTILILFQKNSGAF